MSSEFEAACSDLDPAQRRRLILLIDIFSSLSIDSVEQALRAAVLFEHYILSGDRAIEDGNSVSSSMEVGQPDEISRGAVGDNASTERLKARKRSNITLSPEARQSFEDSVAAGASNHDLARQFQLTIRQAHGLRIGYARKKPAGKRHGEIPSGSTTGCSETAGSMSPSSAEVISVGMDDVVQFLRQIDDVVVKGDEQYVVNSRFTFNALELLERANRHRRLRAKPLFVLRDTEFSRSGSEVGSRGVTAESSRLLVPTSP